MHSMTEATSSHSYDDPISYMDAYPGNKSLSKTDIAIVLFGMLFPLITQIGHAHAH
jgi:zinc transporter 9